MTRGILAIAESLDPTATLDVLDVDHLGETVKREIVALGGAADDALIEPTNAAPGASVYGLPMRTGDGHDVNAGAIADAVIAAGAAGSLSAKLRAISRDIGALLAAYQTVVDTELPAAVAAGDAMANPTAPQVLAHLMGWNTATWDRLTLDANKNLQVSVRNGATTLALEGNSADGVATSGTAKRASVQADLMLFNETSMDRQRNNAEATLLASAARTATTNSPDQTNYNGRGVVVTLDVTATPNNAETLTVAIQSKGPVSGKYVTISAFTALVASALGATPTTATFVFSLYPGVAETAAVGNHEAQALVLPRTWRVLVTHSAGGSWTYTVGAATVS